MQGYSPPDLPLFIGVAAGCGGALLLILALALALALAVILTLALALTLARRAAADLRARRAPAQWAVCRALQRRP